MSKQTFVIVGGGLAGAKAAETLRAEGFGGRLLFNRSDVARGLRSFLGRASVGVFADYTADQGTPEASTLHYGIAREGEALAAHVWVTWRGTDVVGGAEAAAFREVACFAPARDR